jgi:uncharacterized membrane protein YtjA (UPF0391 family)
MPRSGALLLLGTLSGLAGIATAGAAKLLFFLLLVTCLSVFILSMWQAEEPHDSGPSIK